MWAPFLVFVLIAKSAISYDIRRVFDVTNMPLESFIIKAGENLSVSCPGVNEHSLIQELEWLSLPRQIKVVQYMSDSTTVWTNQQHRITLVRSNFALAFHPAEAKDSGDYVCLVNNRHKPEAVVRLIVQDVPDPPGRPLFITFTSRSVNLSWAPSQNTHFSAITHYIIHSRVGEHTPWNLIEPILTINNHTHYQILNLRPYTVYSFRIVSVNAMGASAPGIESFYMVTLREIPTGKPTINTAHNLSSSSIHISWHAPPMLSVNGEFLGYRICYKPRYLDDNALVEIFLRDTAADSYTIGRLETFTQYLVSLQVVNPEGPGPNTTVLVMTDEGVPSKPRNLSVLDVTSFDIYLSWLEPRKANGHIDGYFVYFMTANYTDVRTFKFHQVDTYIKYTLDKLKPNTEYTIFVKAFTSKNEGEPSESTVNKTDISGPSAPILLNLTCQTEDTIFVQWERPHEFFYTIDYYYIYIYLGESILYANYTLPTSREYLEVSYSIKNITTNTVYKVEIRGASISRHTNRIMHGDVSVAKEVFMQTDCDKLQQYMRHTTVDFSAGMIAGVGCAAFAFVLAISAFVVWRKCFRVSYYYLDDMPCSVPNNSLEWNAPPAEASEHKGAITVDMFSKHVAELHADGDIGFSKEYEAIQASTDEYVSEQSKSDENRSKNRYLNIIAYDHSRVQLLQMSGQKKNIDYINANYIDGFQWTKAYIGTQGPLPSTFDCFWRMVWEQRVTIIVMITNLVERGRRKCDMYWPKEGIETYGIIQVRLVREDVMATYTVRTLQIKHLKIKKAKAALSEKIVYQYHYTNWPDHGTPDHPLPVLHFVKKSASANLPEGGPIVVHCSAGVGRTGTYIVLDAMLRQIRSRNEVNIFGFLRHIRSQRNFLVQTEEQYIFIHDALLEAIESGETNINREQIPKYVQALQNPKPDKSESWKSLEVQYRLATCFECQDFNLVSANKVINQPKNRSNIVPVESSRVHLTPKPGEDGSDYINATWMQGFQNLREFIITQHPLRNTVKDFWQMVWDHNAQTIVMLGVVNSQDYDVFWPMDQETIDTDNYKIKLSNEHAMGAYISREFTMQSLQDDYELHVRMVHCSNWPHQCSSMLDIFHLPTAVQETQLGFQNGPVVVIDQFGGPEAATFCCLATLKKQLLYENHADVYMYAKLYHNKRPGLWTLFSDYVRLHLALQALCSPPEGAPDMCMMANGLINGTVATTANERPHMPPEEIPLIVHGRMK